MASSVMTAGVAATRRDLARAASASDAARATCLVAAALAVRIGSFFAPQHLSFDDGTYGASVLDMRHGLVPYKDVFSSQGPLHLPLLYLGDILGGHTLNAPRVTPVLAGLVVTLGVWASTRRLGASHAVAMVAALLIATTGSMIWTTGPITGDGPAAALAVAAVWSALAYRDEPRVYRAVITGALAGAAMATKPIVFPVLIPITWWLAAPRRPMAVLAAYTSSVAAWFAAAVPFGLGLVWRQSVTYHTGPTPTWPARYQLGKLLSMLALRDAVLVGAVALGLVAALPAARHRPRKAPTRHPLDLAVVGAWTLAVAVVLVFERAMYANHLAAIVVPLAFCFALRPPPLRWLAWALIALVPWSVVTLGDILWPRPADHLDTRAVAALRALPPNTLAISDEPGMVWRSGRATPPQMNDTTIIRTYQDMITTRTVAHAAADPNNCAVLIWTFRFNHRLPGLRTALAGEGYELVDAWRPDKQLWVKHACEGPK